MCCQNNYWPPVDIIRQTLPDGKVQVMTFYGFAAHYTLHVFGCKAFFFKKYVASYTSMHAILKEGVDILQSTLC